MLERIGWWKKKLNYFILVFVKNIFFRRKEFCEIPKTNGKLFENGAFSLVCGSFGKVKSFDFVRLSNQIVFGKLRCYK
jgi:hypothetical protein